MEINNFKFKMASEAQHCIWMYMTQGAEFKKGLQHNVYLPSYSYN